MTDDEIQRLIDSRDIERQSLRGCEATMGDEYPCCFDCPCALRDEVLAAHERIKALEAAWEAVIACAPQLAEEIAEKMSRGKRRP